MQAQARICPVCIDDHSAERLCSYAEMRYRIDDLQAALATRDARIAELEAECEALRAAVDVVLGCWDCATVDGGGLPVALDELRAVREAREKR